jgi:hypothetical protein
MSNGAAKDYGVTQDTSIADQLKAAGRYLVDRGVKAGMGLLDIYSAINAGRVGLYDRSDANNGGAPGTVRDKVEKQMAGHRIKAAQLLGYQKFDTPSVTPAASPDYPGYVPPTGPRRSGASEGIGYVSDNNGGWRPAESGEAPQAMFYGEPRNHPRATPAYIRSGTPGVQASYVPPEMRGPFRKQPVPLETGVATVGTPTTDAMPDMGVPAMPGMAQEAMPPINEQLAQLLISNVPSQPETPNLMNESEGLNFPVTAPNISIPSQAPQNVLTTTPPTIAPANTSPAVTPDPVPASVQPSAVAATIPSVTDKHSSFLDMLDSAYQGAKSVLDDTQQGIRQAAAKGIGAINALPTRAAAAVLSIPTLAGYEGTKPAVDFLQNYANSGERNINEAFGVDKPKTLFQKAGALTGQSFTPMGRSTLAATAITAGVTGLANLLTPAPAYASGVTKEDAENIMFPKRFGTNEFVGPLDPRVSHTFVVNTSAGPAKLPEADYKLLGVIGAATIGAVFAPTITTKILNSKIGVALRGTVERDVQAASMGVKAFSTRLDLLRTNLDDKNAGLLNISRRIGVDPLVINDMRIRMDTESGSATRNYANAAVNTGDMQSPNFSFRTKTPVLKLAQAENDDVTRYMHLQHTYDEIREQERILLTKPQSVIQQTLATSGPPTVRGMDKTQVLREIANMEATPQGQFYKDFRAGYKNNLSALRHFEATGEYATMSRAELQQARTRRPNEIFQKDLDIENTDAPIQKASQTLGTAIQEKLRFRMENETKGYYIDKMVEQNPDFARQVTAEELKKNIKSWGPNTVSFYRRGVKEYWLTDPFVADVLKMDPYFMTGVGSLVVNGSKKLIEQTTTGRFAPWFALTNLVRNTHLAKISAEPGFVPPTVGNVLSAVPEQLYPQLAKHFADKLDTWSNSWLKNTLGPQVSHGLSLKLAQIYDRSMYALLAKKGGVHTSMFLDYNKQASNKLSQAMDSVPVSAAKDALNGFKNLFDAMHNAPNFAYAAKNIKRGISSQDAALSARQLTGDPQKTGQFALKDGKRIRFDDSQSGLTGKALTKGVNVLGGISEIGRQAFPWWNVTTQGMKRVGQAYLADPAKFVGRAYLYTMMPAAAIYFYNRGLGTDPNGISYSDYQMNRRSEYNTFMNWYIGIPGRPAEEGISIPLPHELAIMSSMMTGAMHHLTHSDLFSRADDFMRTALALVGKDYQPSISVPVRSYWEDMINTGKSFASIGLVPAMPSLMSIPLAATGYVAPQGPFGGAYKKHEDPFDDKQGINTVLEQVARVVAPGIADIGASGFLAYTHAPDVMSGLGSAIKASTRRATEKTPFVRDIVGWRPPVAGSTQVSEDLFDDKKVLSLVDKYYTTFDPTHDYKKKEPGSSQGRIVADYFMPDKNVPKLTLGLPNKPPVNALYMAFMKELDRRFKKDVITDKQGLPTGGVAFPSQMAKYSAITRQIKDMRKIDEGNLVSWQQRVEAEPELASYLKEHKIPLDNPFKVRNFLEQERQTVVRQLMYTLKAVEQDFQQRLGDPNFRFEDLDPNKPYLLPQGVQIPEFVPMMPSYAHELGVDQPVKRSHHKK